MPSFKINPQHIMEAVYSYPFPEVRDLLDSRVLPAAFMLNTLPVETANKYLQNYNFQPVLDIPSLDGEINLDELHLPVIERIRRRLQPLLPGIANFSWQYPI